MTKTKAPAYQWYPRDALADMLLLSDTEELIYRRLLDYQWLNGEVPSDMTVLARAARVSTAKMRSAWKALAEFFPVRGDGGGWQNRRMERDRATAAAFKRKRSREGKAGAIATWGDGVRWTYAMRRGSDGIIKIGWSRNPDVRARELARQFNCEMVLLVAAPGGPKLETKAQVDLAEDRVGTEWFRPTAKVMSWVREHLGPLKVDDHFQPPEDDTATGAPSVHRDTARGVPRYTNGSAPLPSKGGEGRNPLPLDRFSTLKPLPTAEETEAKRREILISMGRDPSGMRTVRDRSAAGAPSDPAEVA